MGERLFAVRCGSMLKAVRASNIEEAAALARRLYANEREGQLTGFLLNELIFVAEEGVPNHDVAQSRYSFERAGLPIPAGLGTSRHFSAN
jgi:hypothetical protein